MVHPKIWSFSSALLADIGGSLGLVLGLRKISLFNFSKGICSIENSKWKKQKSLIDVILVSQRLFKNRKMISKIHQLQVFRENMITVINFYHCFVNVHILNRRPMETPICGLTPKWVFLVQKNVKRNFRSPVSEDIGTVSVRSEVIITGIKQDLF